MPKDLFLDFVNGRDGTVLEIKDKKDRIDVIWRPANSLFGKSTLYNIPKECVLYIPPSDLGLEYGWLIVLCDGTGVKGIINEKLDLKIAQVVKKKEELEKTTKLKESALALKERDLLEKTKKAFELFDKSKSREEKPSRVLLRGDYEED